MAAITLPKGTRLFLEQLPGSKQHFVRNMADSSPDYDRHEDVPAIEELRSATVALILNRARTKADPIVKVSSSLVPQQVIGGYVTFLSQIAGKNLPQLESSLGLAAGRLSQGALVYYLDASHLDSSNIAPRGDTSWSGGVTPREIHDVRESHPQLAVLDSHPDYPRAATPVFQMVIYGRVCHDGRPKHLGPGDIV